MNDQNAQASNAQPGTGGPTASNTMPAKKGKSASAGGKDQRLSTQNHLQFREIRDNIVMMRDGSLRMVIRASAINFDLMSPGEQDAVEYAYQGFLNSLHFPISIVIRSRKIDLNPYLDKLEGLQANQENQLLAGLMEDYIYNVRGLLEEVNIMNKEFYVIVPYYVSIVSKDNIGSKIQKLFKPNEDVIQTKAEYDKNKSNLLQRTNTVAQGLAQMGVRVAILSTQELIELFYSAYNLEESQVQTLTDVSQLTTPYVTRDGGPLQSPASHVVAASQLTAEPAPDDMFSAAGKRAAGIAPDASQPPATVPPPQAPAPAAQPVAEMPAAAPQTPPPTPAQPAFVPPNPLLQNQPSQPAAPVSQTPPNPLETQINQPPGGGTN